LRLYNDSGAGHGSHPWIRGLDAANAHQAERMPRGTGDAQIVLQGFLCEKNTQPNTHTKRISIGDCEGEKIKTRRDPVGRRENDNLYWKTPKMANMKKIHIRK